MHAYDYISTVGLPDSEFEGQVKIAVPLMFPLALDPIVNEESPTTPTLIKPDFVSHVHQIADPYEIFLHIRIPCVLIFFPSVGFAAQNELKIIEHSTGFLAFYRVF
jgi:hypothetical protein